MLDIQTCRQAKKGEVDINMKGILIKTVSPETDMVRVNPITSHLCDLNKNHPFTKFF